MKYLIYELFSGVGLCNQLFSLYINSGNCIPFSNPRHLLNNILTIAIC